MHCGERAGWLHRGVIIALLMGCTGLLAAPVASAETKSYVMSSIVPAMYAHEGDCKALEPIADPGLSPVHSMHRRMLVELGKTPAEIDTLMKTYPFGQVSEVLVHRVSVDGKGINVFQNPEFVPDPHINTVVGPYAIGFNLDGKGSGEPGTFEDPYTHEKGVDNQYYRAIGCIRSSRVVAPEKSSHWEDVWHFNIDKAPAVLISVTGEDLSRDGEVTVTFGRAIERVRHDAASMARRDMTFRMDPNPLNRSVVRGRIQDGFLIVDDGHVKFGGPFATTPFDIAQARVRFNIKPDGSLEGLLAGYQTWLPIYHFFYGEGYHIEVNFGINVPGVYHAFKKFADADPDPLTGQNRRISITYALRAVPAYAMLEPSEPVLTTASAAGREDDGVPLGTPLGITIQVPAGGSVRTYGVTGYRERDPSLQYFADARGMALYTYDLDKPGQSSCYEACAQAWPPLIAPRRAKPFGDWSLVRREDGRKQWAYQGSPLYTFAKDSLIGQPTGVPLPKELEDTQPYRLEKEESQNPDSPWRLARYKMADVPRPNGIGVAEVVDANGEVLVDHLGRTLYSFEGDPNRDESSCQGGRCVTDWIPLAAGRLANPVGSFTLIRRADGITQWAYKGRGLYRFKHDIDAGNAKGIGVDRRWHAALIRRFYLPPQVNIRESVGRGKVLTDEHGMTLYRRSATRTYGLARSVPVLPEEGRAIGTHSCDAECMKTWIPFEAPRNAQPADFWEVITREDGKRQWSYKGYALYRYAGDKKPGDVNGTFIYDPVVNYAVEDHPNAEELVANNIKSIRLIALLWSHMFP